jgi:hypothetical protein
MKSIPKSKSHTSTLENSLFSRKGKSVMAGNVAERQEKDSGCESSFPNSPLLNLREEPGKNSQGASFAPRTQRAMRTGIAAPQCGCFGEIGDRHNSSALIRDRVLTEKEKLCQSPFFLQHHFISTSAGDRLALGNCERSACKCMDGTSMLQKAQAKSHALQRTLLPQLNSAVYSPNPYCRSLL